jgi:2'-5' RNA ligase
LKKESSTQLYFIAIVPPSPVLEEAGELKIYFKDKYNSKASLNSPPHITLHMPFQWKEEKENLLIEKLNAFTKPLPAFELKFSNFNCFPPRVIYIDVLKNDVMERLQKELHRFCKKELNLFNANYKEHVFQPHLTLAFRDLRKQQFLVAWEEFREREFERTCQVRAISLLKHDGVKWGVYSQFQLGLQT